MGADIHAWIEGKDKNGNWFVANPRYVDFANPTRIKDVDEFYIGRNYPLFSALGNVRNEHDIPFIQKNRGLPEDVTDITEGAAADWDLDGHSFGYVTAIELQDYFMSYINANDESIQLAAEAVKFLYYKLYNLAYEISDYEGNCLNVYDMRLVFWFDN